MAQPTLSDLHVNVPLTNLLVAYMGDDNGFVADKVFPAIPVQHKSNAYYLYDRDAWMRSDAIERAPATESVGSGWTVTTDTYTARVYAIHKDIDDQIRANADSVFNLDRDATLFTAQQLKIKREQLFVTKYFGGSIWTGDQTGVTGAPGANQFKRWDVAGSTPIEDVRAQALSIASLTGYMPNVLVLGPQVANALINNPEIVDRVKYTSPGFLSFDILATAFGVERILVPTAVQNTATEGLPLSTSFIWGKNALLAYANPNPGLMTPSAGYIFSWQGYLGGTNTVETRKFRMEPLRSDRVESEMAFDMKIVAPNLAVFFNTAIS